MDEEERGERMEEGGGWEEEGVEEVNKGGRERKANRSCRRSCVRLKNERTFVELTY